MTLPDTVYLNACSRISDGELIESACRNAGCSRNALWEWSRRTPANGDVYARARSLSASALEEEALDVARSSTPETYGADRVRIDTLKWAAAKRNPRDYGDSVKHEHSGTIVGELHLAALQAPRIKATIAQPAAVPLLANVSDQSAAHTEETP